MNDAPESAGVAGVWFEPKRIIADARGSVMHHLRSDSPSFAAFGEVYSSTIFQGSVKAWKKHRRVSQNIVVPVGSVRFVIFDDRVDSPSRGELYEITIGRERYGLLHIPPGVWYGFQGVAQGESVLVNCVDEPHDPAESERLPEDSVAIPHRWSTGEGSAQRS